MTVKRTVEKSGTTRWQQITPARYIYTSQELTVASVFQESKGAVLGVYFGGMTFTEVGTCSKKYRAEISAVPKGDERALCVDWTDQISATEIYHHRLYVPRVEVSETADAQWTPPKRHAGALHSPRSPGVRQHPRGLADRRPHRPARNPTATAGTPVS